MRFTVRPGLKSYTILFPTLTLFLTAASLAAQQAGTEAGEDMPGFRHETHRDVECRACHESEEPEHLHLTLEDCRSCHHQGPLASSCTRCHAPSDARTIARPVVRTLDIRLGSLDRPERALPFRHSSHGDLACRTCHTEGLERSAEELQCTDCHGMHHGPTVRCRDCHEPPAPAAHDREVHLGCGGSGCHERAPAGIRMVPRTRSFCLVCHDGMQYHKPGEACASCHRLPPPRTEGP